MCFLKLSWKKHVGRGEERWIPYNIDVLYIFDDFLNKQGNFLKVFQKTFLWQHCMIFFIRNSNVAKSVIRKLIKWKSSNWCIIGSSISYHVVNIMMRVEIDETVRFHFFPTPLSPHLWFQLKNFVIKNYVSKSCVYFQSLWKTHLEQPWPLKLQKWLRRAPIWAIFAVGGVKGCFKWVFYND